MSRTSPEGSLGPWLKFWRVSGLVQPAEGRFLQGINEKFWVSSCSMLASDLETKRYSLVAAWASHLKASFCHANKTLWVSVSILVLLAALTSFLTGLSLQRPADAAPVGTGDSWTSLQQLLWPYTGLQHHGPPPV